jgi:hypothetical protein
MRACTLLLLDSTSSLFGRLVLIGALCLRLGMTRFILLVRIVLARELSAATFPS